MRHEALWLTPCLLLAGCDARPDPADADTNGVHVAADEGKGVSMSVPGLDAKLSLPAMDLARHVDLDGIKLAPGTRVRTVDVAGRGNTDGSVSLTFAAPQSPSALIAYYREAAGRAGFAVGAATPAALTADKGHRHFALSAGPEGTGSTGTLAVTGG